MTNSFTLDGRLKPGPEVTPRKVAAVKELLDAHLGGNRVASAQLQEVLTTSDAIFNLAYLTNLNFVPQYDAIDRSATMAVAGSRVVPDFRPATLYSLNRSWTDGNGGSQVLGSHGEAPVIPEGTAYPYAYISGEVSQGAGVLKRGLQTDWTLESRINDGLAALDNLPQDLLQVAADTEVADVWGALATQTTQSAIVGGTNPDGTVVTPNPVLSRAALIWAQYEVSQRQISGRYIQNTGGWTLVVPIGRTAYANWILFQSLGQINTNPAAGTAEYVYGYNGPDPLAGIEVLESEWLTGNAWMLIPKVGGTRRPVVERLSLRGFETPTLAVDNHTGNYISGSAATPFEGNFSADVITLKLRQFGGGVVWDNGLAIAKSSGAGV
jgi:hypothetical protein